jgi:hypothetical protein
MTEKKELKILTSPIKKPLFSPLAFSLKKYHFIEANRIRCYCDYKTKDGKYICPNYLEINSNKVFNMAEFNPTNVCKYPGMFTIPVDQFDVMEPLNENTQTQV